MWSGTDTGYASNRAMMFQQLPTAGLPFQFETWQEYEGFVAANLRTGVIEYVYDIRWDVRPSPRLGTVEVRICDGVSNLRELAALTALTHCLVVDLTDRLSAGETLPTMPPWHVQENKWRAARYGLDAEIILDADGNERLRHRRPRRPAHPARAGRRAARVRRRAALRSPTSRRRGVVPAAAGGGRSAPAATWSPWSTRWCASSTSAPTPRCHPGTRGPGPTG